ncbi:GOGB1 protein, partial [Piaya cayana]|nr:GOGB1 protein [Piaya cayana]
LAAEKRKELSVLLLELQEAQEEIDFLKKQLKEPSSRTSTGSQTGEGTTQLEDDSQSCFLEGEEQLLETPNESGSSSSLRESEIQRIELLQGSRLQEAPEGPVADPEGDVSQSQELLKLRNQIAELQILLGQSEESYKNDLGEKSAEITSLKQLVEEHRKKKEDADEAFSVLSEERDRLLHRVEELSALAEPKRLEEDLALSEKQRLSDNQSDLLREQIRSLRNEFKSKENKIEALQKDLDEAQGRLSDRDGQLRGLRSRVEGKEREVVDLEELLRRNMAEREELSQKLTSKGREAANLEQLLAEQAESAEKLRQTLLERERQMTELSLSMSEKMVLLNEEKFSLENELRSLKERTSPLAKAQEEKDKGAEEKDASGKRGEPEQQLEAEVAGRENEDLANGLELLKKENEQVKRKLQAALVNRKELLKKVGRLEDELMRLKREPGAGASAAREGEREENGTSGTSREASLANQPGEEHRVRLLSEKESELRSLRRDLAEKEAAEARLLAVIEDLRRRSRGETNISSENELVERQRNDDEAADAEKSPGGDEENEKNRSSAANLDENQNFALKERISALEQEKEQLQKRLQEAVASRRDTVKKAQEKERHHQEQLKQQKDEYDGLRERFEKQSEEKESVQAQLRRLREGKGSTESARGGQTASDSSREGGENPANRAFGEVCEEEGEKLEELQVEKLEEVVSHAQSELARESELVFQLREHVARLVEEVEGLKRSSERAEAKAASLEVELEEKLGRVSREAPLEDLKTLLDQKDEEIESLNLQLREKSEALAAVRAQLVEKEDSVTSLCRQLETQARAHEEQRERLRKESLEAQEKQDGGGEAAKEKQQMQRKLQAALISRKEALRESKILREELSAAKIAVENLSVKVAELEAQIRGHIEDRDALREKSARLAEEREKLIAEVEKALGENQKLEGCCKNLKNTLDGFLGEKKKLEEEVESLKSFRAAEGAEWREKHGELQREYETLLRSYENVSDEAERIRRVLEAARREKQDVFTKLRNAEAQRDETERQLREARREMEGMKEKMRKFAKAKQQKILELEEENEKLRAEGELRRNGGSPERDLESPERDVESSRRTCQSLSTQLEAVTAEKELLNQEITDLKRRLQLTESKLKESSDPADEEVAQETTEEAAGQAVGAPAPAERTEKQADVSFGPEPPPAELEQKALGGWSPREGLGGYAERVAELTERIRELEDSRRASERELGDTRARVEALASAKTALETQLEEKLRESDALRAAVAEMEGTTRKSKDELVRVTELKDSLEAEKDELEERLMNQLAELNGSIGNYQQDATDLQAENERLKQELRSLQGAVRELEEEKRLAVMEKNRAGSEKQKEIAEKLRSGWRGDANTHVKELQELLKEKQQEVKQLQKECIKSREKNSGLERTIKALEFVRGEARKEVEAAKEALAEAVGDAEKARAELALCKVTLDDTQSEAARLVAEGLRAKEELRASKEDVAARLKKKDEDLERRLGEEREKRSEEVRRVEERLAASRREKERAEGALGDLRAALGRKDEENKRLEGDLNKTLAQLAAFTRSMSSLQDDRDRVIDEAKTWEKKFTATIRKKEEEIRSREEACAALEERVKGMAAREEELRARISSLEHNNKALQSESEKELQHHQTTCQTLQEEKKELLLQLEESQQLSSLSQAEQQKLESEISGLKHQLTDLQSSFTSCELAREELRSLAKQHESSIHSLKISCQQLEADLRASKGLTDKLHEEIAAKEQKILTLLSAEEDAAAAALSELQRRHAEEVKELERRLEEEGAAKQALEEEKKKHLGRLDQLAEKVKASREESKKHKAQLDSFSRSMSSLQDDRDRVLGDYRQLEGRHLAAIVEKDRLIQEAAAENNELKEELRGFRSRADDLNAENAKLSAELVRCREDLNRVIAVKDSQQKELLRAQLQRIQALEKEKTTAETRLEEAERAREDLRKDVEALREEKAAMSEEIETLTSSLSGVRTEMASLLEEGPVGERRARLKAREEEARELSRKLSLSQRRIEELEEELLCVRKDASRKVGEAEDKLRRELKHLHHDAGIMRNEAETAEERVAELARDLMEMEQKLLDVADENKGLRAQIQAFGKSMSSLQDSRDRADEELRDLKQKYSADLEGQKSLVQNLREEVVRLQEEQESAARERDEARSELLELRKSTDERGLSAQIEKLQQQLRAKDDELLRLSSELEGSSDQLKSFSKAMGSLQDERDRLLDQLDKRRKTEEAKQQAEGTTSTAPPEVQSLKKALSSLQDDRDRVVR